MPDKCEDEELRANLDAAKKSPRNFCLVAMGSTAVKLILSKKKIPASEMTNAKAEAKGNTVVQGVCVGDGTEMVFQVLEESTIKPPTIKKLISEQTGLKMTARFQVVNELAQVKENDDDNVPQAPPLPPQQQQQETAPPPAPPPPPPDDAVAKAMAQLVTARNKLDPVIVLAGTEPPAAERRAGPGAANLRVADPSQRSRKCQDHALALGKLAKELAAPAAQPQQQPPQQPPQSPPQPPQQNADPKAAQWAKEWAELEPKYLAALKTGPEDLTGKMKVIHAYATEQAEATQYDKALTALGRLRPMIDQASQGKGPAGEIPKGIVEKRKFLIERFKVLPGEIRPELDKLRAAIAKQVPDEDPDELCADIEAALDVLFEELQDEIDVAINKGDMKVLAGLKTRVTSNELVKHLVANPLINGTPFQQVVLAAIEEVETKLAS